MKRRQDDVALRLLEDYLEHVERWIESSRDHDRMDVVVLEVMEYRRHTPGVRKRDVATIESSPLAP